VLQTIEWVEHFAAGVLAAPITQFVVRMTTTVWLLSGMNNLESLCLLYPCQPQICGTCAQPPLMW
jgi:hypothetical protein